jgi:hypothetical protein
MRDRQLHAMHLAKLLDVVERLVHADAHRAVDGRVVGRLPGTDGELAKTRDVFFRNEVEVGHGPTSVTPAVTGCDDFLALPLVDALRHDLPVNIRDPQSCDALDLRGVWRDSYESSGPAWDAAIEMGIDVTQLLANLELSPTERLVQHAQLLRTFEALHGIAATAAAGHR